MVEGARERGIGEDALAASIIFLYLASVDTSAGFIGSAILTLLRTPSELERLRSGAVPLAGAVEEPLRYETPAPEVMRVAVGPHELAGQSIAAGDALVVLVGAADRGPASFAGPGRV